MKALRVVITAVAMLALPLVAAHAQGRGNSCPAFTAGNSGKVPPGQAKKCPAPTPDPTPDPTPAPTPDPTTPPPTGTSFASGTVFADLDANGVYSPFSGDTVLAGVGVTLLWQGAVYKSATTDVDGSYRFDGLGDTGTNKWELCVSVPGGFVQGPAQPGGYTGCSGAGYAFGFNNGGLTSMFQGNFSMLPQ